MSGCVKKEVFEWVCDKTQHTLYHELNTTDVVCFVYYRYKETELWKEAFDWGIDTITEDSIEITLDMTSTPKNTQLKLVVIG